MKITLPSLWLFTSLCIFPSFASAQDELRDILSQALEYRALQSFWCQDDSGTALLRAIDPNRRLSAGGSVAWFECQLPLLPTAVDSAYSVVIRRLRLNGSRSRAVVRFTYHQRVKAYMRLQFHQGHWRVKQALIRQKEGCQPGSEESRFVWDF